VVGDFAIVVGIPHPLLLPVVNSPPTHPPPSPLESAVSNLWKFSRVWNEGNLAIVKLEGMPFVLLMHFYRIKLFLNQVHFKKKKTHIPSDIAGN
jgi:hypothetical protein